MLRPLFISSLIYIFKLGKSKRFKVVSEKTESIYLNEKELEDIYKLDLDRNIRLDRIRDLFLVGC